MTLATKVFALLGLASTGIALCLFVGSSMAMDRTVAQIDRFERFEGQAAREVQFDRRNGAFGLGAALFLGGVGFAIRKKKACALPFALAAGAPAFALPWLACITSPFAFAALLGALQKPPKDGEEAAAAEPP